MGSRHSFPFAVFVDPPPVVDAILAFDKANIFFVIGLFLIYKLPILTQKKMAHMETTIFKVCSIFYLLIFIK